MMTTRQSSKAYSPEVLAAVQQAFDAVWTTLYSNVEGEMQRKELSIKLSRTLIEMAANGVTDSKELWRSAVETMALSAH